MSKIILTCGLCGSRKDLHIYKTSLHEHSAIWHICRPCARKTAHSSIVIREQLQQDLFSKE